MCACVCVNVCVCVRMHVCVCVLMSFSPLSISAAVPEGDVFW